MQTAPKVNETVAAVKAMEKDWCLIRDLRGGTAAMREKGTVYLPKRAREEDGDYRIRCSLATLFPAFDESVSTYVGRVFAEPVQHGEDMLGWIKEEVVPDMDRQGNNLDVFTRGVFNLGVSFGLVHVLVESPPSVTPTGAPVVTMADQKAARLRPYTILMDPARVLGWIERDGVLQQVRLRFWRAEADGEFAVKQVEQVRVYELVTDPGGTRVRVRVYEEDKDKNWVLAPTDPERFIELTRIPFVTYYTKRTGYMTADPPLRELAYLNAKHYMMQSSNDAIVDTAQVPILCTLGVEEDPSNPIVIGAKFAVSLPADGDMKYVEHTGKAIEAGRVALDALKDEMREAGAKLLVQASGTKTATQATEEAARDNSALAGMVQGLQDFMAQVLDLLAMYRKETDGGTIELQPNLTVEADTRMSLEHLTKMADANRLSDQSLFEETQRRGLLNEELTWEEEQARIQEQMADMLANPALQPLAAAGALPGQAGAAPAPAPGQPPSPPAPPGAAPAPAPAPAA